MLTPQERLKAVFDKLRADTINDPELVKKVKENASGGLSQTQVEAIADGKINNAFQTRSIGITQSAAEALIDAKISAALASLPSSTTGLTRADVESIVAALLEGSSGGTTPAPTPSPSPSPSPTPSPGGYVPFDEITSNLMGINIGPCADWSPDGSGFRDAIKVARKPTTPSGGVVAVDANGWPLADFSMFLWDSPGKMHGTYQLSFTGQAQSITFAGGTVSNKTYDAGTNTTKATVVVTEQGKMHCSMTFTGTSGGAKNIKLMRPTSPGATTVYDQTRHFTDRTKKAIGRFIGFRTLDFTGTNSNGQVNWSDRTLPSHWSQNQDMEGYGWAGRGCSWEYVIALANEMLEMFPDSFKAIWINVPAKVNDDYIRNLALLFRDGANGFAGIDPRIIVWIEYGNEMWNTGGPFAQAVQNKNLAVAEVQAGNSALNFDGLTDAGGWDYAWRRIAKKTCDISNIFRSVFGDAAMHTRIRPCLQWQQGDGQATASKEVSFIDAYYGSVNPGNPTARPIQYFISGAGASAYFAPNNNDPNLTINNIWTQEAMLVANWRPTLVPDANWVAVTNTPYVSYEGGPSFDASGNAAIDAVKTAANMDPRMKQSIIDHYNLRSQLGGSWLFSFILANSHEWEFTPDIDNLDTPKLQAITALRSTTKPAATFGVAPPILRDGAMFDTNNRGWGDPSGGGLRVSCDDNDGRSIWFGYTFRITAAGTYKFSADINQNGTGTVLVIVDNQVLGTVNLSGYGILSTPVFTANLQPGIKVLRLKLLKGSAQCFYEKVRCSQ